MCMSPRLISTIFSFCGVRHIREQDRMEKLLLVWLIDVTVAAVVAQRDWAGNHLSRIELPPCGVSDYRRSPPCWTVATRDFC